ncbi:GNAT family N-acetyltransferase [Limnohabitans sp.]|uniref:GNAT family N-acetyltransferase n=1 Tax=Limnohabitans sp. TaxID=1907725 RepID=UPI0037C0AB3C
MFDAEGQFVGACALKQFSAFKNMCDLGYWVQQSRQRVGAVTAAVLALCERGFGCLDLTRIKIVVADTTLPSP